jgi:hypothetical protein
MPTVARGSLKVTTIRKEMAKKEEKERKRLCYQYPSLSELS